MTPDERSRLALAHQHVRSSRGLLVTLAWAPAIPVEGAPPEGSVDYDGLHEDHRTLIDAVPGLAAENAMLRAARFCRTCLARHASDDDNALCERFEPLDVVAMVLAVDKVGDALIDGNDALAVALMGHLCIDVARSAISHDTAQATAVRAGRGGRLSVAETTTLNEHLRLNPAPGAGSGGQLEGDS